MSNPKKLAVWTLLVAALGALAAYGVTVWMAALSAGLGV